MDSIFHRVSVRHYLDKPVEEEKLEKILRAAMQAPSAKNQQPWRFTVVTDKKKIAELAAASQFSLFAAKAPVIIVVSYVKDCGLPEFAPLDTAAAVENMWLEADALGLGGVWMGVQPRPERMQKVGGMVHLPDNENAFAMFALGYPAREHEQRDRFHPEWVRHL